MSVILHHTVPRNDVVFSIIYSICKVRSNLFKNHLTDTVIYENLRNLLNHLSDKI